MRPHRHASNLIDAPLRAQARHAHPWPGMLRHIAAIGVIGSAAMLGACGGGVSIGFGAGTDFDSSPPDVTMAASSPTVSAGQQVMLIAAASDESGIDVVAFFRIDPGEQRPLGTLSRPPYTLSVTAPDDGRSVMRVFARAIDNVGKRGDSEIVDIAITR